MSEFEQAAQLLGDPDPRRRLAGVRKLARACPSDEAERGRAVELLGGLARDEADFVRWNVAMALGQLADPRALPHLRTLAIDQHANVRLRVALALGLIGEREAGGLDSLVILTQLARDPYKIGDAYPVRAFAALALGILGEPGGADALVASTEDEDPEVRWHATVALGDLCEERALEALVERARDEVAFVRAHAVIALTELGSPEGLEVARRVAAADEVERVRMIAGRALAAIGEEVAP